MIGDIIGSIIIRSRRKRRSRRATMVGTAKENRSQINTLLPDSLREKLRQEARRLMISEGAVIRQALVFYFDHSKES